uniref:Uncharacterized protein n=1 Tax=Onchocerca volvulus TaxID=6282 RepID=A0A8R1TU95_ONCVO
MSFPYMNPFTTIIIIFFTVSICYMQVSALISDRSECKSSTCWHEKRSEEKYKTIRFIRSHLGIMRFGKRSDTIRLNNRIELNDFLHASAQPCRDKTIKVAAWTAVTATQSGLADGIDSALSCNYDCFILHYAQPIQS